MYPGCPHHLAHTRCGDLRCTGHIQPKFIYIKVQKGCAHKVQLDGSSILHYYADDQTDAKAAHTVARRRYPGATVFTALTAAQVKSLL